MLMSVRMQKNNRAEHLKKTPKKSFGKIIPLFSRIREKKELESFDGTKISYYPKNHGKKRTCLVYLHGLLGNSRTWERIIPALSEYPSIAIDLRGHGLSERPDSKEKYLLEYFAKDITKILLKEKINNFILIGHSFGGLVATEYERIYPGCADGFIFIDSLYKSTKWQGILKTIKRMEKLVLLFTKENCGKNELFLKEYERLQMDQTYSRIYLDLKNSTIRHYYFTLMNLINLDNAKSLEYIQPPSLIIHGKKDLLVDYRISERMSRLIKNSKINIIDAHHFTILTKPDKILRPIEEFLRCNEFE